MNDHAEMIKIFLPLVAAVLGIVVSAVTIFGWFSRKPPTGTFMLCDQSRQVVTGVIGIIPNGPNTIELIPDHDGFVFVSRKHVGSTLSIREAGTRQEIYKYVIPDFGKDVNEVIIRK
jgi:hypothetical protein